MDGEGKISRSQWCIAGFIVYSWINHSPQKWEFGNSSLPTIIFLMYCNLIEDVTTALDEAILRGLTSPPAHYSNMHKRERYLGAMIKIIHTGCIHEGLVEVGAGINTTRDHQLASGIYDFGSARNHEFTAHLLYDAILNINISFKGAVIVHHFPPFDEDPHYGSIGKHDSEKSWGSRQVRGKLNWQNTVSVQTAKGQTTLWV